MRGRLPLNKEKRPPGIRHFMHPLLFPTLRNGRAARRLTVRRMPASSGPSDEWEPTHLARWTRPRSTVVPGLSGGTAQLLLVHQRLELLDFQGLHEVEVEACLL